ncbi:Glu/Leu/Phe/Val dehydrogenase dimerization domain-containing protein [Cryptosporangium phraense]|uniref:Amino acid dehydrogenase n=1 Tax=Cryptosporangium phraense TaxID=2593070 RepID=A0A545AJ42_9ACTN|nr:Glu/Leu/Phe/Val dehydrogenase dimerization domain-containing protein [Cryptosporangium phraense]TQS40705.1 amino acid dehydrogenase [Cryptosporangium phraense]
MFTHEELHVTAGRRSGVPIALAIHSTALGQALGGCRIWHYADWRDGVEDALRLSSAMTAKNALAGLANGGGKTVAVLPPAARPDRRELLLDVGDAVAALGGRYGTGPDVGSSSDDMTVIGERTSHVFCRPVADGGSGSSSPGTAAGVIAALRATVPDLASGRFAVVGLGSVGADVARRLAAAGARLTVSDVRPDAKALADELGADWASPDEALTAEGDVLVPAALGGVLTADLVPSLRCRAIVGPANNQLASPDVAGLLHERGIRWAPDYVVSAGGIIHAVATELYREAPEVVEARIEGIGDTLTRVYDLADAQHLTPAAAAEQLVAERLTGGTR